ncbi:MAG: transcription antitermination factor NusB [Eubacteriales bacterium]
MNRRKLREHIFKLLFRIEFNEISGFTKQIELYISEIKKADSESIAYINEHVSGIIIHLDEIDSIINEKAEHWKASRMAKVDITVLRLAIYEIKYNDKVPTSIAINEAVELAKKYGGEHSPSFINGVLAKIVE